MLLVHEELMEVEQFNEQEPVVFFFQLGQSCYALPRVLFLV